MAQFGRPSADTLLGSYTDDGGGSTNIYLAIDESSASDTDYVQSELAPAGSVYVTKYTNLTDPLSSSGHIVRYRYRKNAAGGAQIDMTFELRQGYVNEGAQGTLIATATHTNVAETITAGSITLSGAEADAITDYTSLFLRIVSTQV